MTELRKAAEMALEALDNISESEIYFKETPVKAYMRLRNMAKGAMLPLRQALAQPKYRRGDRLLCLENEEYCVIHISGTDRQWVKFSDSQIAVYTNEQVRELFELMPKEKDEALAQPEQEPVTNSDLYSTAGRLALELECLLLDTKDISIASKWWDSAHEALGQWQEFHLRACAALDSAEITKSCDSQPESDAMRLYSAVDRLAMQAGEDTKETIDWLCGKHGGMFKLFESYFSPKPLANQTVNSGSPIDSSTNIAVSSIDLSVSSTHSADSAETFGKPEQAPVAMVTGYKNGHCVIAPIGGNTIFQTGLALYTAPISEPVKERISEPLANQEPVAWMASDNKDIVYASELDENTESRFNIPLYTTPTKRQWVGLTDGDKDLIAHKAEENDWHDYDVVNSTEAALKEKNNG